MRLPTWLAQHLAALRALLVLTVLLGVAYPLAVTAVAQLPGLRDKADGSLVSVGDKTVGSALIGQSFTDADGNPLDQYFQTRPSAAGDGYDPTATSATNLGPESVVDTLPDPALDAAGKTDDNAKQSLLTQVCSRSPAVGKLEGVDGRRPYCTADGVGAVLGGLPPRRADRPGHPGRQPQPGLPGHPVPRDLPGRAGASAPSSARTTRRAVVTPIRGDAPAIPGRPRRRGHRQRQRARPADQPGVRAAAGARVAQARGMAPSTPC